MCAYRFLLTEYSFLQLGHTNTTPYSTCFDRKWFLMMELVLRACPHGRQAYPAAVDTTWLE